MFLSYWLVSKIVAASVIEAIDYPTPEEFFLAYDGTNTLFMYGGSKDTSSISNVAIYYDGYKHETGNAYPIKISETGDYKALVDVCGTRYLTDAVTVGSVTEQVFSIGSPDILAFHHGNFDNVYGDGDVNTAATNGHVYADTPTGTYSWGTLTANTTTSSNTTYEWTPLTELTADVLMVAGGGGGGGAVSAGGGGAGGVIHTENMSLSGTKTVIVGNGGEGGYGADVSPSSLRDGFNGSNTSIDNLIAIGGGGGAGQSTSSGANGGSGGGGRDGNGGNATSEQGNDGGSSNTLNSGGGGGGAGGTGTNGNTSAAGNGGTGVDKSSIFSTTYGDSGWFASGGGGGGRSGNSVSAGTASPGGGASGTDTSTKPTDAQKHTGGGGGGAGYSGGNSLQNGGNGGSGIVLLSYQYSTKQLTYDGYDKLTVANTSNANVDTNLRLGSNVWNLEGVGSVYISKPGDYRSFTVDPEGQMAYFGNVTVGTVSQHPTDVATLIGSFSQSSRIKLTSSDGTQFPSGLDTGTNPVASSETTLAVGTTSGNGAIYVFEKTNGVWTQVQKMTAATPISSSTFPVSVAIHGDIIVTCTYGPNNTDGFVYVFEKTNGVWPSTETAKIDPQYERLTDIDIYGTTIVATERHETNRGRFYIFEKTNGLWPSNYTSRIDTGTGYFTWGCAIHGDNLTIKIVNSSVRAYERNTNTGNWDYVNTFTIGSNSFGEDISIYGDVLAANNIDDDSNKGIVYIYKKTNGTWLIDKQIPNHGITNERFGRNIKLISSTKIIIGSDIHAYIYEEINGTWVETFKFEGPGGNNTTFGRYVSATPDGSTVFVSDSSEDTGAVFVYTKELVSPPSSTYDGYNKLTVAGVADQTLYKDSNSWSLGTASDVYISEPGEYIYFTRDAATAFLANVTVGTVTEEPAITPKLDGGAQYVNGALDNDGHLYMWGLGSDGQLGQGDTTNHTSPVQVKGVGGSGFLENIVDFKVGPGNPFVIACDYNGNCYAWGNNGDGQLGQGDLNDSYTPLQVKGVGGTGFLENIINVSCGHYHSLACDSSGNCYAWGDNYYNSSATQGQLGDGTIVNKTTPIRVLGVGGTGYLTNIIQVAGKPHSSHALSSSGHVYCWGANQFGECGDGTYTNRLTPVQVVGVGGTGYLSGIIKLAGGDAYYADIGLALGSDGRVYAWGYNSFGQLGQGNNNNSNTPVIVKGVGGTGYLENIIDVACGGYHCFALDSSGTVYGWGNNNSEAHIGDGTVTQRTTPVKVLGVGGTGYLSNIVAIGGERFGGSAMDADGNVYAWGGNQNGQVGDGTSTSRTSPVQVLGVGGTGTLNLKVKSPLPSLTYDGLNSLKVTGAETSSYITYKAYESNKLLACGTDLNTYPLYKTGNYRAEIANSNTFTFTSNVLVPATNIVPLYQYPPTDGTTSGITESVVADVNSIWTISNASYGNGQHKAQASVAATSTSVTAYHAFDANLTAGFETTSSTIGTLTIQLPSATTIHKYVIWPKAADDKRPKSWKFQGSTDGTNWDDVHAAINSSPNISGDIKVTMKPDHYNYYRLNVSENNGNTSSLEIGELVLWGDVPLDTTPIFSDSWTSGTTTVTFGSSFTLPTVTNITDLVVTGSVDTSVPGTYYVSWSKVNIDGIVKRFTRRFVVPYSTGTLSFHYGGFDATDYGGLYSTKEAAAANGFFYSDTTSFTNDPVYGSLTVVSNTTSNTEYLWTPITTITSNVLMVAGGGGGGGIMGGGGGAGGLVFSEGEKIYGTQTIVVGNGGGGGTYTTGDQSGDTGNNTTFLSYIASGGGAGYSGDTDYPISKGGSGGGYGSGTTDVTDGYSTQLSYDGKGFGNPGGSGGGRSGGGGGGAGTAGQDRDDTSSYDAGAAGQGKDYSSTFGTIYGESGWFAGGGGGGGRNDNNAGAPNQPSTGGQGGGGDGTLNSGTNSSTQKGIRHTGGGGGGSGWDGSASGTIGGDGGSGIVIIKVINASMTFDGFSTLSVGATHDTTDESFGYTIERSSVSASGPWSVVTSGVDAGTKTDVSITEAGFYRATVQGTVGGAPAITNLTDEITYTPTSIEDRVIKNKVSGDRHTLAVLEDGTVYAWGRGGDGSGNNAGGLGDGSQSSSSTPVQVVGVGGTGYLTGVDSVYTNTNSSYAIKDGNVYAWGRGGEGDMGNGTNTSSLTPVQVKGVGGTGFLSNIVKLAGGTYRINAISSSGDVYGWGRSVFGSGLSGSQNLPVQVRGVGGSGYLTGIVDMKAYYESGVMAVKSDGTVYAWGWNSTGYHGSSTSVNASATYPVQVLGVGGSGYMSNVVAIGGGGSNTFSVLLKDDGTVYASGYNQNGELGDGTNTNKSSFVQVSGLTGIVKITGSATCTFTLALKNDGTLYSWGLNSDGQLGDGTTTSRNTPVQVLGPNGVGFLTDVIDIDTGDKYSIAFTKDGSVYTWGDNTYGQLGDGTTSDSYTPKKVLKGVWPGDGSYLLHGHSVENQTSLVTGATLTFDGVNKLTVTATNGTTVETFGYTIERATNTSGPWTVVTSGVAVGATKDVTISQTGFYRAIVQGTAGGTPVTVVLANEIV